MKDNGLTFERINALLTLVQKLAHIMFPLHEGMSGVWQLFEVKRLATLK